MTYEKAVKSTEIATIFADFTALSYLILMAEPYCVSNYISYFQ